ncbi:10318_t:CDS:2, partial [Ambispora leptoticha]
MDNSLGSLEVYFADSLANYTSLLNCISRNPSIDTIAEDPLLSDVIDGIEKNSEGSSLLLSHSGFDHRLYGSNFEDNFLRLPWKSIRTFAYIQWTNVLGEPEQSYPKEQSHPEPEQFFLASQQAEEVSEASKRRMDDSGEARLGKKPDFRVKYPLVADEVEICLMEASRDLTKRSTMTG